jgi:predicted membrane protein
MLCPAKVLGVMCAIRLAQTGRAFHLCALVNGLGTCTVFVVSSRNAVPV